MDTSKDPVLAHGPAQMRFVMTHPARDPNPAPLESLTSDQLIAGHIYLDRHALKFVAADMGETAVQVIPIWRITDFRARQWRDVGALLEVTAGQGVFELHCAVTTAGTIKPWLEDLMQESASRP